MATKLKVIKYDGTKKLELDLGKDSNIIYIPNFVENSNEILENLKSKDYWKQGEYMMFGKPVKTPRLLWALRDKEFEIPESYDVTDSSEFTPIVISLKEKIEKLLDKKLSYAQLNYYRDGNDYIGWHNDSEVDKGDIIASISLGADRKFSLRYKKYKKDQTLPKYELFLKNSSLLIMDYNASNKIWKHCLPKMKKVLEPRINITFRIK